MNSICKYVSHKIRKIRWRPALSDSIHPSELFVTGSWDEEINKISVWSCAPAAESLQDGQEDIEPKLLSDIEHIGDVTDLKFLNIDTIAASSSTGTLSLYRFQRDKTLKLHQKWESLHHYHKGNSTTLKNCPCTAIAIRNNDIVTVGDDGRICYLNAKNPQPISVIEDAESCSINAVMYLKQFEIITANMRGQLKVWDVRSKGNEPVQKFCLAGDQLALLCLSQHPAQHQVIATGGQDGTLYIWDMRQDKYPVTLLSAHSSSMLEVKFHPNYPNHLFTCSEDGGVWHWDCSRMCRSALPSLSGPYKASQDVGETIPWLACDATKHRLEICSLLPTNHLPVNSLDIEDKTLICGADNEAFYLLSNLIINT